ncbi:TPA: hypothetical protein P5Q40_003495 [Clostridioides difficile]|nr:Uncharacterised protein [Clostridioides difficile]HBF1865567.1 hypothetical protein [Clostridioides difficile]HBF1900392.1 hypothetical protein [Clostridioides difficile]HBF6591826.1 hypothetical protein [Clostridioides difficile]HBG4885336.1 hypothetical protein [Clostridioides difficile]
MINNKSEIINKLFFNELKELIDKYNNIDDKTVDVIEKIFTCIEDEEIKNYLIRDNCKLQELVNTYNKLEDLNIDEAIFFAWYNLTINTISIDKASEYYDDLTTSNYIEVENHIIYTNERDLSKYAEDELETMLSMEHHIDRLLHKDMLIDMWLNNTSKEEVIEEILMSDDIEDILNLSPEYAFTLANGIEYRYSEKEE